MELKHENLLYLIIIYFLIRIPLIFIDYGNMDFWFYAWAAEKIKSGDFTFNDLKEILQDHYNPPHSQQS